MKKRIILCAVFVLLFSSALCATRTKTVCLNMIVKNESDVIKRCLTSVKPLIDYWVIVDTGSSDGTQKIIKEFMKDMPGELHERPWDSSIPFDFEYNRNIALELAKGKADYVLFIDADEVFEVTSPKVLDDIDKDVYYIITHYSGLKYPRTQLVNNHLDWKWVGVLHEVVVCPDAKTYGTLEGITNLVRCDGARSKDPKKFQKDAQILEAALKKDPTNRRNQFYLAQRYLDAEENELAIQHYHKRVAMGGWDQEIFWSLLQIARLQEIQKRPKETIINGFTVAHMYRKTRAEPVYYLAEYLRKNQNYEEGYRISKRALFMPVPDDILFVYDWIYDYGMLLEFSICAYWVGEYEEAKLASEWLLLKTTIPSNVRECVEKNLTFINERLKEASKDPILLVQACGT